MSNNPELKQRSRDNSKVSQVSYQKERQKATEEQRLLQQQIKIQKQKLKRLENERKKKQQKIYKKSITNQFTSEENEDIEVPVDGQLQSGSRIFMMHCAKCHGLEHLSNEKKIGPSLGLMFNRKAGSDLSYRNYSHVLANSKIYWTANNLFRFMYNPTVFIMGIKCSGFTLKSEEDRADLIQFLRQYSKEMSFNIKIKQVEAKGYSMVQSQLYVKEQVNKIRK